MQEQVVAAAEEINQRIARRVAALRAERGPASGYLRCNLSPPEQPRPMRIVEVEFPAGQRVVLEGAMTLTQRGKSHRLETGDCLAMRIDGPIKFRNPTRRPARYAVVIAADSPRRAAHLGSSR